MADKFSVGLQLYSVRKECAKDFAHVLREVAKMGYDGVEFAGYWNRSAEELRTMLEDVGLKCCGTHIGLATLQGEELEKTVEFNKVLGNSYLIVPGLEEHYTATAGAWKKTAGIFNEIAERLKPHRMQTGYHNHFTEFKPMEGGACGWDIFFSNTSPDVIMQLDTGNAMHAGVDVRPYVSRYPNRAQTVHFKEYSSKGTGYKTLLGDGEINWNDMLELCRKHGGTKWIVIEQEHDSPPEPLDVAGICLERLRKMM